MKHHFRSQQKYHFFVASKTPFTRRYKNVPPEISPYLVKVPLNANVVKQDLLILEIEPCGLGSRT
jgi:hypothetical protein